MQTAIQEYFHQLSSIAGLLQSTDLARRIDVIAAQAETDKATLLIVGCNGNGRCSVANLLLGAENLLPVAPDKATAPLRIVYGENGICSARSVMGLPLSVTGREELHELYTHPSRAGGGLESVTLKARSELLKRCDVAVESLDAVRPDAAWRDLVAGVDYVLLVTSAMAALNQRERAFVTNVVVPTIGVSRLGVLVNQLDLVTEQDAVLEYVKASFRSFGEPRLVAGCSAAKGTRKGRDPEVAALQSVLTDRVLPALSADLHGGPAGSLGGKLALCIDELEATARERLSVAGLDLQRIDRQIQSCTADEGLVQKRVTTLNAQVGVLVNLIIREDFLHHVHQFRLAFAAGLESEVAGEKDLTALRRNLPSYIEAVWQEFLMVQQARSREQVTARLRELQALAEADLRDLLGPEYAETSRILDAFKPGPDHVRQLIPQAKGDSTAGTVASVLKWAGAITVVLYPPAGGLYLLGEAVGRLFKSDIQAADRQALLTKASEALENVERQITGVAIAQFERVHTELTTMVAQYYAGRLEQLSLALADAQAQVAQLNASCDALNAALRDDCPRLRRQLTQFLGA